MAQKMDAKNTGKGEGPTTGHNIADINKAITDGLKKLFEKDQQIKKAMVSHVDHLKADRKKLVGNMKADTKIDGKDLTLAYKVYARQEDAKLLEEEDRDRIADNLKIVFDAMIKGGQLDFIDADDS